MGWQESSGSRSRFAVRCGSTRFPWPAWGAAARVVPQMGGGGGWQTGRRPVAEESPRRHAARCWPKTAAALTPRSSGLARRRLSGC